MGTSTIFTTPSPFHELIRSKNCQSNSVIWSLWGSSFLLGALTSSFFPFLPVWGKIGNIWLLLGVTTPILSLYPTRSGEGVPGAVCCSLRGYVLNAEGFVHRKVTEIYDSFHVISENKQFLHTYDFPPLLAEPDLQWWPRNKRAYSAETIKSESYSFLFPSFIVIVLDSFDFDQMRPVKFCNLTAHGYSFESSQFCQIFVLILFSWKLKKDRSCPLTSVLVYLTQMLFTHTAHVKKKYTEIWSGG